MSNESHAYKSNKLLSSITLTCLLILTSLSAHAYHENSWFYEIRPSVLPDVNPDPDIVEVYLEAKVGQEFFGTGNLVDVYTYNGVMPGPTIVAEVGDKLIVHFTNSLPEETTVHWHGLELPADMDGSNIAQQAVQPGGYFRYEFDLLRASTFWYHPHIRSNEQVEKGLHGMLIVKDHQEDFNLGLPWTESWLILDDLNLDENGQISEFVPLADPLANAFQQVNGREGNTLLVNGRANATGIIFKGIPHRIRMVNTSNTRFMRVSIPGHTMYRIGGDGGLLETPIAIEPIGQVPNPMDPEETISDPDPSKGLLLTPGERADIVFTPNSSSVDIEWHDIARGRHTTSYDESGNIVLGHMHHDGHQPPQTLLSLSAWGYPGSEYVPPASLRDIDAIDTTGAETILAEFGHTPANAAGDITFFVQRKENTGQCPLPAGTPCPLPFPMVTPADAPVVNVGDTVIVEVRNMTGGDHNFHLHGFMMQPIEVQHIDMVAGTNVTVPAAYLEDKDTVILPRRPGGMGTSMTITRLAVTIDDTGREGLTEAFGKVPGPGFSGGWVFHCHLLEHADRGMMSFLQVLNP